MVLIGQKRRTALTEYCLLNKRHIDESRVQYFARMGQEFKLLNLREKKRLQAEAKKPDVPLTQEDRIKWAKKLANDVSKIVGVVEGMGGQLTFEIQMEGTTFKVRSKRVLPQLVEEGMFLATEGPKQDRKALVLECQHIFNEAFGRAKKRAGSMPFPYAAHTKQAVVTVTGLPVLRGQPGQLKKPTSYSMEYLTSLVNSRHRISMTLLDPVASVSQGDEADRRSDPPEGDETSAAEMLEALASGGGSERSDPPEGDETSAAEMLEALASGGGSERSDPPEGDETSAAEMLEALASGGGSESDPPEGETSAAEMLEELASRGGSERSDPPEGEETSAAEMLVAFASGGGSKSDVPVLNLVRIPHVKAEEVLAELTPATAKQEVAGKVKWSEEEVRLLNANFASEIAGSALVRGKIEIFLKENPSFARSKRSVEVKIYRHQKQHLKK